MRVTLKLFASLGSYLPAGARDNSIRIEAERGATPLSLMRELSLPPGLCHLVLVNGRHAG
jgi:hypothetical protein